ncbi:MAG: dockerin type I domain-containing protein [Planctomycetota bacterium]
MRRIAILLALGLAWASPLSAATYTLDAINGSDTTGDGSDAAPWASMAKAFTVVAPGDTVLLRPGNYGAVTFKQGNGLGSADGHVTYRADPDTTTPRPASWYEDGLDRPDPADPDGKVVFTNITFDHYSLDKNATTKTGTPEGHYVTLDGLNVVGNNINIVSYVSHVTIRNCNVFGKWGDYSSQITNYGFNLYRSYYWGSNYRHILIEDCYATRCRGGVILLGNFHDITVRGCHFHHVSGSVIRLMGSLEQVTLEGNHAHRQIPVADTVKHTQTVVTPGTPAHTTFTVSGDVSFLDHVSVIDADTGTEELRKPVSFDHTTYQVVLDEPLSFDVDPGDTVKFWDDTHGSGVSVRAGNFTLRGNRIHDCGGTRGIYLYTPGDNGYSNIVVENNLFYDTLNQYTTDFNGGLGNHCIIRNNTFVGRKHRNYDGNGDAYLLYGFGLGGAGAAPNADPSTIVVANNLIVGTGSAPAGAIVKNNIVYAGGGFEEDAFGDNAYNIVYYQGEPVGSEPQPFHGSGAYFVGGPLFDDLAFTTQHGENFNDAFRLAEGARATFWGDPALATATDMVGTPRDPATPSVGCYEYAPVTVVPGDADGDGDVDLDDFAILKTHFGTPSGATRDQGDFDGDGDVDLDDFVILKTHFGTTTG